jgi:predicted permease
MTVVAILRSFLRMMLFRGREERAIDEELHLHLAMRTEDLMARGLSRPDAERAARAEFGDLLRWKEQAREARGVRWVDDARADVAYGLRWLRRAPAFTAAAVLSLSLGIGANTAVFNLLNAVLWRSLPVRHPESLVVFSLVNDGERRGYLFSHRAFSTFSEESRSLADILAASTLRLGVEIDGRTAPTILGQLVSGNYFAALGVPAAVGRPIGVEDAVAGAAAVAVISYGYWKRQFGADPGIVGRSLRLNGQPVTVIGVSAPEFFGTHIGEAVEVSMPLSLQPLVDIDNAGGPSLISGPGDTWLELIGRLRSGVPVAQAQAEADALFQPLVPDLGEKGLAAKGLGRPHVVLEPGSRGLSELRRRFSRPLLILMAVVALVLVISCANVANLLLARAASRRQEMAVRVSLGAGRARLVRQMLTESLLLSLAGAAGGWLIAAWAAPALDALLTGDSSSALTTVADLRVLSFTLAVSFSTALVFGLAPALGASDIDAFSALKHKGAGVAFGGRRFGLRRTLVATQVAVSAVLLVGAALFIRTLINLRYSDLGFDRDHVLAMRLEPHGSNQKRQNEPELRRLYGNLLARVQSAPGVRAASLSGTTPLGSENPLGGEVAIPGYVPRPDEDMRVGWMQVYPGYFDTMGIALVAGRDLTPADDDARSRPMTVVNESLARRFFGTPERAVGARLVRSSRSMFEIVGVVRDARDRTLREPARPTAYATFAHAPTNRGQMTLLVRAAADPQMLATTINGFAHEMDPAMPMLEAQTLRDRVGAATRQERLMAVLSALFGALALSLAMIGLSGVVAYTVARRRAEFGVRLALGASPASLKRLVLSESLLVVVLGLVVGVVAAAAAAQLLSHLLFELSPLDPGAFLGGSALLLIVATVASYLPARQAARVDPLVALRQE